MTVMVCENGHAYKTRKEVNGSIRKYCRQCMRTVNFIPKPEAETTEFKNELKSLEVENVKNEIKPIERTETTETELRKTQEKEKVLNERIIIIDENTVKLLLKIPGEVLSNIEKDESLKIKDNEIEPYVPILKRVIEKRSPQWLSEYADEITLIFGIGMLYYFKYSHLLNKKQEKKEEKKIGNEIMLNNWQETIKQAEVIK